MSLYPLEPEAGLLYLVCGPVRLGLHREMVVALLVVLR